MSAQINKGKKKKKQKKIEDNAVSLTAGQNAAIEEVNAYERDARTAMRDNEFLS